MLVLSIHIKLRILLYWSYKIKMKNIIDITVGRRKSAVARVKVTKGNGKLMINRQSPLDYFKRESLVMMLNQPFKIVDFDNKHDFLVNVYGGGLSGQAGAIRLGIARSIEKVNPDYRKVLKENSLLTRDSREVERQKPGQPGARKKFQFSKR